MEKRRTGLDDLLHVEAYKLREFLVEWLENVYEGYAPVRNLSERSNVSVRTISKILNSHAEWVTFTTADMLLTAIGAPWLIDELRVKYLKQLNGANGKFIGLHEIPKPPESLYYEE